MTGNEFLAGIKKELMKGRRQHRMGVNILGAFGYARRRQTAIDEINEALDKQGLRTSPKIDVNMPLTVPYVRFYLVSETQPAEDLQESIDQSRPEPVDDEQLEDNGPDTIEIETSFVPSFKVAELTAAYSEVECISVSESIHKAYTIMSLKRYSQLVVANSSKSRATDIKGIISYQSIANSSLHGSPTRVGDCLDPTTPLISVDDDISRVIHHLIDNDVVLVIGKDKRLSGIVTAWDLADEFQKLVGPFKWIGEIESRLQNCLFSRLGRDEVERFLSSNEAIGDGPNLELLTLGDLQYMVQNPELWGRLGLPFDRVTFADGLNKVREMRNRLMHFRDPLNNEEAKELNRFCQMVRRIPEKNV